MSKLAASVVGGVILVFAAGLVVERQARTKLNDEVRSLRTEVQQLADQIASLQQDLTRLSTVGVQPSVHAALPESQLTELTRLQAEMDQLRERMMQLERAGDAISNQIASAAGANVPFIYPDSTKRKDYAFSGHATPQSALQSMLWAITQSDVKVYQASLGSEMAEMFARQIEDLPEGVMPGGFKNGAMYKASGYRVLEETSLSNEETRLKVFLEGRQNLVLKLVFRRIGNEWKLGRNE